MVWCALFALFIGDLLPGSASRPGTAALDAALGASAGHIIALRPGSTARWDRYVTDGLLDDSPRVVHRLPGVIGADVPAETISLRVRSELAHGREVHEGVGTLGALGCYASHLKAWRAVIDSGVSRALVFEEDAILTQDGVGHLSALGSFLADFIDTAGTGSVLRDGFDVALLGYIQLRSGVDKSETSEQQREEGWVRLRGAFWGTHAYLITRRGATKLIAQVRRLGMFVVCAVYCVILQHCNHEHEVFTILLRPTCCHFAAMTDHAVLLGHHYTHAVCCVQAEPISAQVDAYMGWMAEFEPSFVMLAAPQSFIQQGGHNLDTAVTGMTEVGSSQPIHREVHLAVQNRQCWKCDLDKYFPGGPVEGGATFRRRVSLALLLAFSAGIAVATTCGSRVLRRFWNCAYQSVTSACKELSVWHERIEISRR